ncbi:MAG: DUF362 domain-containing protein [Archaeoglobales archaeon]|nr:DUF362 domain-containing protein [Archaeoglobales archaeon]
MPYVIVERSDGYENVRDVLKEVFETFEVEEEVLLKPNFLKFDNPENGCITHPDFLKAILEVLNREGVDVKIVEGGFSKDSADLCFERFGLKRVAYCINLNKDEFIEVEVKGKKLRRAEIAKSVFNKEFISVPKMKVHHLTKVTLGIKNNIGFLKKPAIYMHACIDEKLADLLKVFWPKITIVDGIIGGNYSEISTKPLKHGVIVAGDNIIAVDYVASQLMGFKDVGHIRVALERYKISEDEIETSRDVEKLKKQYTLSFFSQMLGTLERTVFKIRNLI